MGEFWCLSGINSPFDPSTGEYQDYVWDRIETSGLREPDRHYASRLGTQGRYDAAHKVGGLGSKRKLNAEARGFANGNLGQPETTPGQFRGKQVRALFVAPKTTVKTPGSQGLRIDIFWSPNDQVPNQRLIGPDSLGYWRKATRGGGEVWPVKNRTGSGIGRGHDFNGFLKRPPILKRKRKRRRGSQPGRYVWQDTGKKAPSALAILEGWLSDPTVDLVLLAHSQGTNIAAHILRRGYRNA